MTHEDRLVERDLSTHREPEVQRMRAAVRRYFDLTYATGLASIVRGADPQLASEGGGVAFTGTRYPSLDAGGEQRVCIASSRGLQVVSRGPSSDRSPRWSPDGGRLAFVSVRGDAGEACSVVILDVGSGEAIELDQLSGSVEQLAWSPAGDAILVCVAGELADRGDVPAPGRLLPKEPPWLPTVQARGDPRERRELWCYEISSGRVGRLSPPRLNVWEAAWCGPCSVVMLASEGHTEGDWFTAQLWLATKPRWESRLLYQPSAQLAFPVGDPSGERVAVIEGAASDRGVLFGDVVLLDPSSHEVTLLDTDGVDVSGLQWLDERRLGYIGLRRLTTVAGVLDVEEKTSGELWTSSRSCGRHVPAASFARDGSLAAIREGYASPPEVVVVRDHCEIMQVSLAAPHIDAVIERAGRMDLVHWLAADGVEIDGFLCRPSDDRPAPLVLLVHGGPIAAFRDIWSFGDDATLLLVARGYAVLHANPRGSAGRGQAFAQQVIGDMGGGDAADLVAGVDEMVARGVADPRRLGVLGSSYGGYMATWLPARYGRFAVAVAVSPVTDWVTMHYTSNIQQFCDGFLGERLHGGVGKRHRQRSPLAYAASARTPTLLAGGARDLCTPMGQSIEYYHALVESGVDAQLVLYPEEGHGVKHLPATVDLWTRVLDFFRRYLGP